jgi:uncharacterized membrane protein YphA (DoxX/SURF4 family)
METLVHMLQLLIALGILNVWLLRYGKPTPWRGGDAQDMTEEFEHYGLPGWVRVTVGALKICFALLLIAGLWYEPVTTPAAVGLLVLMLGAVLAHVKVRDPLAKALPALSMAALSLVVALGA